MRIGIGKALEHKTPEEWAKRHYELGCRSALFPVNSDASDELIDAYIQAAAKYDLKISEVGIWKNAISPDAREREEAMEYSIRQLKLADRVGAECCVNLAGALGPLRNKGYAENFSRKAWNLTVRMIQEVIDEAKPQHTFFVLEPMPWMYPSSPEEYMDLIEAVGRDQFAAHLDVINMINCPQRYFFQEQFVEHCFEVLGAYIKGCHVKDIWLRPDLTFQLKECACGEGTFCLERYAELANALNPDIAMTIEHLNSDQEYLDSLAYVQKRLAAYL